MAEVNFRATKFVVQFNTTAATNPVRNALLGPRWDDVKSFWETHLVNIGEFLISAEHTARERNVSQQDDGTWEFYPKVIITGESNLTRNEILESFDTVVFALRDQLKTALETNPINATNITFIIKRPVSIAPEYIGP